MPRILRLAPIPREPIEREFEGWIVTEIEDYFAAVGVGAKVFAVSPAFEAKWPADEHLISGGKLIGLQMKRPLLRHKLDPKYPHLYWQLKKNKDDKQLDFVKKREEIFYCLPTFTSRDWRKEALHHCIFWRPGEDFNDSRIEYVRTTKRSQLGLLDHDVSAYRWGAFAEQLFRCKAGRSLKDLGGSANEYLRRLEKDLGVSSRQPGDVADPDQGESLVLVNIDTSYPGSSTKAARKQAEQ